MAITSKKYSCDRCGFVKSQRTDHFGPTWSFERFNTCGNCPPFEKCGRTNWTCIEPHTNQDWRMKQILTYFCYIIAILIISATACKGQSAFVGTFSDVPTKLTVRLVSTKSDSAIVVKFNTSEMADHSIVNEDVYDVEMPELEANQKIVVRLMFGEYIAKEWIYRRNLGVSDFSVRLIGKSTLQFQLSN